MPAVAQAIATDTFRFDKVKSLPKSATNVHLIVLVHGWMGNPTELGYLEKALEKESNAKLTRECSADGDGVKIDGQDNPVEDVAVLVHSATSNDGKTMDGIEAGGTRLAKEVNALIQDVAEYYSNDEASWKASPCKAAKPNLSLSFVGNSLGGLYARYALSQIPMSVHRGEREVTITPKMFCTTATPHLGVSEHTYLPIPRVAEYVVANVMQPTGRDLFRYTDVIERITVDPTFVNPLLQFEKRVAWANAYSTDFQVPTATAAFLADIDSVHKTIVDSPILKKRPKQSSSEIESQGDAGNGNDDDDDDDVVDDDDDHFVALVVKTPQTISSLETNECCKDISNSEIARRLDSFGWTKVFCDVRDRLPSVPLPRLFFSPPKPSTAGDNQSGGTSRSYTSRELKTSFAVSVLRWGERFHVPLGHTVLVANSKNDVYASLNAGGQPIMDHLAEDLVREVLTGNS